MRNSVLMLFTFCFCSYFLLLTAAASPPLMLKLERALANHTLQQLSRRDLFRHHKGHSPKPNHVVSFPLQGDSEPFHIGLYYTKVLLGSPPRELHLTIDTGSDITWVSCASCVGCPKSSWLKIHLKYFDPKRSSTSSPILCTDQMCKDFSLSQDAACQIGRNCSFDLVYLDGGRTSGRYVSDLMHFNFSGFPSGSEATVSSSRVAFGCSDLETGRLSFTGVAVDGILGLGNHNVSIISQLSSQGVVPRVFSHCLRGDSSGGGTLIFGEVVDPTIVYTPLIPSQPHYIVDLNNISVNGVVLQIDPAVFATSNYKVAVVDSGTTLVYLPEAIYNVFIEAVTSAVPHSVHTAPGIYSEFNHCYWITNISISEVFPRVSFNLAGASLALRPHDYLIQDNPTSGEPIRCIGVHKIQDPNMTTVLGDIALRDKLTVYDLALQRIGFADYDCSLPINVTSSAGDFRRTRTNAGESWVIAFLLTLLLI